MNELPVIPHTPEEDAAFEELAKRMREMPPPTQIPRDCPVRA